MFHMKRFSVDMIMKKLKNITGFVLLAAICLTLLASCVGPGLSDYNFKIADGRYYIHRGPFYVSIDQLSAKDGSAELHEPTKDRISYFAYNDKYIFLQISDGDNGKDTSDLGLVGATYIKYLVIDLDSDEYMYFNNLDELKEAADIEHYIDFKKWIRPRDFYYHWYAKDDDGNIPYEEVFS